MLKVSNKEGNRLNMEERILDLSREDLLTALKNRKGYEPEAEKIIINESVRRGLIISEEDLLKPEFNPVTRKFSFFPYPESEASRKRIIRSLGRSMMIPGIIPVYMGILKFGIPKYIEGIALITIGLVWISMALLLMLKYEKRVLLPMILLLMFSVLYGMRILLAHEFLNWSDIFIPVVLILYILYALVYSFILLKTKR